MHIQAAPARLFRPRASAAALLALLAGACAPASERVAVVRIDGSSTVYPISEAVAEEFQRAHAGSRVALGVSGTAGGFKKLCRGDVAIADASRPIRDDEAAACAAAGIAFVELPIVLDAITLVVHPANDWLDALSVEQLRRIWEPTAQGRVLRWADVDPRWPDAPLRLFGPGAESGTYDHFTSAILDRPRSSRHDYAASEDDHIVASGVAGDPHALGFVGYGHYRQNTARLRAVAIRPDTDADAVAPDPDTIASGRYRPLARPLFLYVDAAALRTRADVRAFVAFYLQHATTLVAEAGYLPLPERGYALAAQRMHDVRTGSAFDGRPAVGIDVAALLQREER